MTDDRRLRAVPDLAADARAGSPGLAAARHASAGGADSEETVRALLASAGRGSAVSFDGIYVAMASRVYGLALRLARDPGLAEDIAQEVFVEVWRKAATYDPERGSAIAWILTVAHRRAVDRIRTEQSRRSLVERTLPEVEAQTGEQEQVVEALTHEWEAGKLHDAVEQLSPLQRESIELAYFQGMTQKQVSEQLGVPLGTAKTRLRDALIKLREALEVAS